MNRKPGIHCLSNDLIKTMSHTTKAERWSDFLSFPELSFHLCFLPLLFFCLRLNIDEFKWTIDLVCLSLKFAFRIRKISSRNNDLVLQIKKTLNTFNKGASLQKICKKEFKLSLHTFLHFLKALFFILLTKARSAGVRFFLYYKCM